MAEVSDPHAARERRTLTALRNRLAYAERQFVAESGRYVQTGPEIHPDAFARLQTARRRLDEARRALEESPSAARSEPRDTGRLAALARAIAADAHRDVRPRETDDCVPGEA